MEKQKSTIQNKSLQHMTNMIGKYSELNANAKNGQPNKLELEKEPDSDIDPNLIFDPIKRQLHFLR
jgi:hypothetical protein